MSPRYLEQLANATIKVYLGAKSPRDRSNSLGYFIKEYSRLMCDEQDPDVLDAYIAISNFVKKHVSKKDWDDVTGE